MLAIIKIFFSNDDHLEIKKMKDEILTRHAIFYNKFF
ncbi:hypothetical protein BSG1_13416 [Bacillus sp. SG-1]|nr:hypothetical protein BSG1_13416 [Bacillus sp. SG-1]